ncbi:2-hydroxyisoflavanone dehydratase-like [Lycium barbarum]|uniref:2-hydroxyisoflavanone dehydratase-like n=1 Tax=Lycium barbarum TaxID=112863 RepID=UPI00293EF81B|nr:2-hydroxyisoflavanone dehydratase-like [Lycium barbarum]
MASSFDNVNDLVVDLYPLFRIYKDGRVDRCDDTSASIGLSSYVPPSLEDPQTGVSSKDVTISPHVSARLYLPKNTTSTNNQKLPIFVYYHGGGLIVGSAFSHVHHCYLNILVSESNAIAISIEYRLAPEHDVPTIYQDCWAALKWVASHASDKSALVNKDPWLTNHGDFDKLFIAGDSAGGTIVYNMAMRAGREGGIIENVPIYGSILAFPWFLIPIENIEQVVSYNIWMAIAPTSESGINSSMINPLAEKAPCLSGLACSRLFLCIGEKDEYIPREIGIKFVDGTKKSGWKGELEFIEFKGEGHCFQMKNPEEEKAQNLIKRIASFIQHK